MRLTLKHALAATILVLNFATPVVAGPLEDAASAFGSGDYATSLRLIRPLADQGDANTQSWLGLLYANGLGVPQDYAEAAKWFRKAAIQGDGVAQTGLGFMYANGRGVPQDYAEAVKLYRLAANQGADRGQRMLGLMYRDGHGVPQDLVRAHTWFSWAAAQGDQAAVKYREEVAHLMTPAQIAEAQKLARDSKPTTHSIAAISAETTWDVLQRFGWTGTWAIACNDAPSSKNLWSIRFRDADGLVKRKLDRGDDRPAFMITIDNAQIINSTTIKVRMHNDDPIWGSNNGEILNTIETMENGRLRTIESKGSDGREYIKDGIMVPAGRPSVSLEKCRN